MEDLIGILLFLAFALFSRMAKRGQQGQGRRSRRPRWPGPLAQPMEPPIRPPAQPSPSPAVGRPPLPPVAPSGSPFGAWEEPDEEGLSMEGLSMEGRSIEGRSAEGIQTEGVAGPGSEGPSPGDSLSTERLRFERETAAVTRSRLHTFRSEGGRGPEQPAAPAPRTALEQALADRSSLGRAVLLAEVLGKPKALRHDQRTK